MSPAPSVRRIAAALAVTLPVIAAPVLVAARPGDDSSPSKRITLCHATSSATNPYVMITVAADAIVDSRTGRVEGHGTDSGTHDRDIIPSFSFSWNGRDYAFPGKNLDGDGAALLANRCRALPDEPTGPATPPGDTKGGDTGGGGGEDPTPDAPDNPDTTRMLDAVAPTGLGPASTPRTVNEAPSTEAVLRVAIRPSSLRPLVGTTVTFRVTGRALGPADARDGTICTALPPRFSLADAGGGMVLGRVICWLRGNAPLGTTVRTFRAIPMKASAGRRSVAPATNSASNAYRVSAQTSVRPRLLATAVAVTG